jgi:hypothetical protein
MNLLTFRKPTHVYRTDACEFGIGGYSNNGRAWRFYIPDELQMRASINYLEFLAAIISVWIDITEGNLPPYSCTLSATDSTTGAGWMRKSNFQLNENEHPIFTASKEELARKYATLLMDAHLVDYSQWFPGALNDVADSLSRDFNVDDKSLTNILFPHRNKQMPKNFKISPLPEEISCYVLATLHKLPETEQPLVKRKNSETLLGIAGSSSITNLVSKMTSFSLDSLNEKEQLLCPRLPKQSENDVFQFQDMIPSTWEQSRPPWTTFHRSSETMDTLTPDSMKTRSLLEFYSNSTAATKRKIQEKDKKKQSL